MPGLPAGVDRRPHQRAGGGRRAPAHAAITGRLPITLDAGDDRRRPAGWAEPGRRAGGGTASPPCALSAAARQRPGRAVRCPLRRDWRPARATSSTPPSPPEPLPAPWWRSAGRGIATSTAPGSSATASAAGPTHETVYDLASLTKVVGLTTALMLAVEEGRLELDAPLSRYVPGLPGARNRQRDDPPPAGPRQRAPRLAAALPAAPTSRPAVFAVADSTPLDTIPGARFAYSDLGAILLTQAVETAYGERIDSLLTRRLFRPLGMTSTAYNPPGQLDVAHRAHRIRLPSRPDRSGARCTTRTPGGMDGVSGHAGIFSTGDDLLTFGEWWIARHRGGGHKTGSRPSPTRSSRSFTVPQQLPPGSPRALGWEVPTEDNTGSGFSRRAASVIPGSRAPASGWIRRGAW